GPSNFTTKFDTNSVLAEEAALLRHQQRRAVNQRNKSNADWLAGSAQSGFKERRFLWHVHFSHQQPQCQRANFMQKWRAILFT
ncbi:MAG TPA: hypothetical protein VD994_16385, partial [Prosthecobacter sp.]|nr:hypothetical protein [Prosthecobacter sp.]